MGIFRFSNQQLAIGNLQLALVFDGWILVGVTNFQKPILTSNNQC
jgi:hypothetical protein